MIYCNELINNLLLSAAFFFLFGCIEIATVKYISIVLFNFLDGVVVNLYLSRFGLQLCAHRLQLIVDLG